MSIASLSLSFSACGLLAVLAAVPAAALAQTQGEISRPLIGIFADGAEVRPMLGVPGAALVGDPMRLSGNSQQVHLAPLGHWALVEKAHAASLSLVTFDGSVAGAQTAIQGSIPSPNLVTFSPNGRNAIIYSSLSGTLQVLTHLDSGPQITMELDASSLTIGAAAIGDDGELPVVWTRGGAVYLLKSAGPPAPLFVTGTIAGIAFLPNQPVLAVADGTNGTLTLLEDLATRPSTRTAISTPQLSGDRAFLSATADGSALIFAAARGVILYRADLTSQTVSALNIAAAISGLERIAGDIFLLSSNSAEAIWMVQADNAILRSGFARGAGRPAAPGRESIPGVGSPARQ